MHGKFLPLDRSRRFRINLSLCNPITTTRHITEKTCDVVDLSLTLYIPLNALSSQQSVLSILLLFTFPLFPPPSAFSQCFLPS